LPSKERDAETGLDYFGARYMSSAQGRFTSPDPHNPITDFEEEEEEEEDFQNFIQNPQYWNRYAYGLNNPQKFVDRDGKLPQVVVGAIVGAAIGGGIELGKQLYQNGGDLSTVDYQKVGAKALSGGVVGSAAGLTFGASLVVQGFATSAANVVGGIAERAVDGDANTKALNPTAITVDAVAGVVGGSVGGAVGRQVQTQVANSAANKLEVRLVDHAVQATAGRSASRQAAARARAQAAQDAPATAGRLGGGAARGATKAGTTTAATKAAQELQKKKKEPEDK
jgi:RHS repeat-associated protein